MQNLREKAQSAPQQPGVYKFINAQGSIIYVGKAKNLRNRLLQYFGADTRPQLPALMEEAAELDFIIVQTELDSLFLENTLIKQYLPKYNIKLRDDKNYAFISIDYSTEIPTIGYARKIDQENKKIKYFGPYSSAHKIRTTLDFTRRIFPYCANNCIGKRPCFYYYLHRCPGVCVGVISIEEYKKELDKIILFFSGATSTIKKELVKSMRLAATHKLFERAARLRDQVQALTVLEERQSAIFPTFAHWDFISYFHESPNTCVNLFKIRDGKLIDKEGFIFQHNQLDSASSVLQTFTERYYTETSDIPQEIYTETELSDPHIIETLLHSRAQKKIPINIPTRGKKLGLIKLGKTNAQEFLRKWQQNSQQSRDQLDAALTSLQQILNLPTFPHRIEGYDISNTQGTNPVSSMVVTQDGLPAKNEYRKFSIKSKSTPDDFAMMQETIKRRLHHLEQTALPDSKLWTTPDLLVIDGGKGQLSSVVEILRKHKVTIPVIGLAKRIEEIFKPDDPEPIILSHDNPALHILQRLRDEAHRFGITFHRQLRSRQAVKSALDDIKGIGPRTKKILKKEFGTIANIREATFEKLANVIGEHKAQIIKNNL